MVAGPVCLVSRLCRPVSGRSLLAARGPFRLVARVGSLPTDPAALVALKVAFLVVVGLLDAFLVALVRIARLCLKVPPTLLSPLLDLQLKTLPTKQQPTLSELPPLQGLDFLMLLLVSETFSEAQAALQEPG